MPGTPRTHVLPVKRTKEQGTVAIMKTGWNLAYAAPVCPMTSDQEIDAESLPGYMRWLAGEPGIGGLVVNGNAGEVSLLSRSERRKVIELTRASVSNDVKVVTGLMADSTAQAVEHIREAQDAGADAALVFPIRDWMTSREPGSAEAFFEALAEETELPVFVFQYPHNRGNASYTIEELIRLAKLPNVVAVKEAIWEVARYQEQYYALKEAVPQVAVLSANDEHLFGTLAVGADGVLVGFAGLVPRMITSLADACARGDLDEARRIDRKLWPLTQAIYRRWPFALRHTRIKAALKVLGRISTAAVRAPLQALDPSEETALLDALVHAGLLEPTGAVSQTGA